MENNLPHNTSDESNKLSFEQIKEMTNDFAEKIGSGSFGIVYKGLDFNGKEIAVKVIKTTGIDDSSFQKEFQNLKRLKHPNIVELVGFCNESVKFIAKYEGKLVTAEDIHTVLCFEYVSNGDLSKHLYDEHTGLSWQKRYKIIKGICDGLKYLRDGLEFSVWHLDLKPDNILLDDNMLPKIADFGLSKILGEDQTRKSINFIGTRGYVPPEYVNHQVITKEFDIFSLGVIMTKVMIGFERYNSIADMPPRKFIRQVHANWKKRLQEELRTGSLEVHCQQVKTCIEIALECMRRTRHERPIMKDIVSRLNKTEILIGDLGMLVQQDFFPRMNIMEKKLHHTSEELSRLSFQMLMDITNNFYSNLILGHGSSGTYYKGVLKNGQVIAVKLLYHASTLGRLFICAFLRLLNIYDLDLQDFFPRMNIMEKKLHHISEELSRLSFQMLMDITNNFDSNLILGHGSSGTYYKGVLKNGEVIAVKLLYHASTLGRYDEVQYPSHYRLKHQNVVKVLVGICYKEKERLIEYEGRLVRVLERHRALCFEFMPNRSLREFLFDENRAHSWDVRFNIIKGTCDGLKYLHDAAVLHLDLKPSKILLDEKMVPKIELSTDMETDYYRPTKTTRVTGMLSNGKTVCRSYRHGRRCTLEYTPPEYVSMQVMSLKYDIFSLGVIIKKIVIGEMDYWRTCDIDEQEFTEQVHDYWRRILQQIPSYPSVDQDCKQVRACTEIALLCTRTNPSQRPTMEEIVHKLKMVETEKNDSYSQIEQFSVNTLELCFPFDTKKAVHCSLQINNKGDDRIAFKLAAKSSKSYLAKLPLCGVVPPRCTYTHNLTMRRQTKPPSESVEFVTLQSVAVADHDLLHVGQDSVTAVYDEFFRKAKIEEGYSVQEMTLKAVCNPPAERSAPEPTQSRIEIVATQNSQQLSSIDVHPEEPLIVTTNQGGILRVWNYKTMTTLNSIEVTEELVHAAKFIAREKWLVAGDVNGCIHVYSYEKNKGVTSYDAHDSSITSLAVHPDHPFVMSSSHADHLIKLWDWKKEWKFTRVFKGHTNTVTQVKFDPENTDSFASASLDGTVKIWSVRSNGCIITLNGCKEGLLCVDYFKRRDRRHLITGNMYRTAQVWDLEMELEETCDEKKGCVETLEGHAERITAVNLYPELSLLITGSLDGTIQLWDSETYKLLNIVSFNLGAVHAIGFLHGTRMVVGCDQGIAVMEISLPSISCTAEETK